MGVTYWLNTRRGDMIDSEENDLSLTCKLTDTLDALCQTLGVTAVSEFVDSTEISQTYVDDDDVLIIEAEATAEQDDDDDFDDDEDFDEVELDEPYSIDDMLWFDATVGLTTFRALKTKLTEDSAAFGLSETELTDLTDEFDEIIEQLEDAADEDLLFHLELLE